METKIIIVHGEKSCRSGTIHREFIARLEKALLLCHREKFDWLVISGGQTRSNILSEARQGLEYLGGRSKIQVVLEEQSRSTSENIQYTKNLIKGLAPSCAAPEICVITKKK